MVNVRKIKNIKTTNKGTKGNSQKNGGQLEKRAIADEIGDDI